jgi:hypothetical protein
MMAKEAEQDQVAIPGTERTRGRIVQDSELKAMTDTCRMLDALPDGSCSRVLRYLTERYQGLDVLAMIAQLQRRMDELERAQNERIGQ